MPGAKVFGVVGGTVDAPHVTWLEHPVPVTEEILALAGPVPPAQVMRFTAPCQEKACCHFDGHDCRLGAKLVQLLPAADATLPPCQIRAVCRWFVQEGKAACQRCPQIVTFSLNPTPELSLAATPDGQRVVA